MNFSLSKSFGYLLIAGMLFLGVSFTSHPGRLFDPATVTTVSGEVVR